MNKRVIPLLAAAALLTGTLSAQGADLLEVYEDAVANDPQLQAAEAAFRAVQTLRQQSRALILPTLSGSAAWSQLDRDTLDDTVDTTSYSLTLQQPLFNREAIIARRQAESTISQGAAELSAQQQEVVVRTSSAYFNLLAARDNLEFARAEKTAVEQQLRQTRQRFEVGLTAITDVHEAQARYDLVVAQEIVAENQVATAAEALRQVTGRTYPTLAVLRDEIPLVVPEPADIDAWVAEALEGNLLLMATRARTETAREEIARRRAGHWPRANAQASYGRFDTEGVEVDETRISLQLNVPIYQGGLVTARAREAAHQYDQAQATLDAQRRATIRQTRDAFQAVSAGISQVRAFRQFVTSAETALRATEAGFEVGTRTAVEVLNAQRELFRARRDFAEARYNYVLGTLLLKQAAGTLSIEDVRQINTWLQ